MDKLAKVFKGSIRENELMLSALDEIDQWINPNLGKRKIKVGYDPDCVVCNPDGWSLKKAGVQQHYCGWHWHRLTNPCWSPVFGAMHDI